MHAHKGFTRDDILYPWAANVSNWRCRRVSEDGFRYKQSAQGWAQLDLHGRSRRMLFEVQVKVIAGEKRSLPLEKDRRYSLLAVRTQ
jgi:hypothetical protein